MAEPVVGATLGVLFQELFNLVRDAINEVRNFEPELKEMKDALQLITPLIREREEYNNYLGQPSQGTETLRDFLMRGHALVLRCKKVESHHVFDKRKYSKRLRKWNGEIEKYCRVGLQVEQSRLQLDQSKDLKELRNHRSSGQINIPPCSVPDPDEITVGLDGYVKQLKEDLLQVGVRVIVVSALGGYGKTTLVKKLCQDEDIKGKFKDNIFYVTVSQTPDVKEMVKNIYRHNRHDSPPICTDEEAIDHLKRLLKQIGERPILLVLDNVWPNFQSVVQKLKFKLTDYKILLTSRSKFAKSVDSEYHLGPLSDKDAMTLFRKRALPEDGSSSNMPDADLVRKVLKTCKGCPLLLTVVGGSLIGEPNPVWKTKAKKLARPGAIFSSEDEIRDCLKSTLPNLDEEFKESFLDLAAFPEDELILMDHLSDMWMELYEALEDEEDAITNCHKLSDRNLVTLEFGYVRRHDLLIDLAIHLTAVDHVDQRKRLIVDIKDNIFPEWWRDHRQHRFSARLLSISTDATFSSEWRNIEAPEVRVVVLNVQSRTYSLPSFLKGMPKLRVMIIRGSGWYFAPELGNFSIVGFIPNLKIIRLENISLSSCGVASLQMKNMEKISLVNCEADGFFQNSGLTIPHAFPSLKEIEFQTMTGMKELYDGICDIVSLKKLSVIHCRGFSTLPEEINKLVNLEILELTGSQLSVLPMTVCYLPKLEFLDISYCSKLISLPTPFGELHNLRTLSMVECHGCHLPTSVRNLENLKKVVCDEQSSNQWKALKPCMRNLNIELQQANARDHMPTSVYSPKLGFYPLPMVAYYPYPGFTSCVEEDPNACVIA